MCFGVRFGLMCGIAGFSLRRGMARQADLAPLAGALAHRGPDGEGFFTFLNMGLCHRRLAIIDVNGGRQPLEIKTPKAPVAGVVNGEIYNYKTLQTGLINAGVTLSTQSDSEPLVHLVMRDGAAAWSQFQGMYAAAVIDGRTGDMWLGTDSFGIKPLYYVEADKGFVFASEPRALLAAGWIPSALNSAALGGVLNEHYSRGNDTLFMGIKRMLPGERLRVREGRIVERWRQLPCLPKAQSHITLDEALEQFETHFKHAVARHLQADVPYGVLLSGGLDSSTIVLMMAKLGVPIRAYTARFAKAGDEDTAAAALAARVGAQHVTVTYGPDDFWRGLKQLAFAMDDLTTDYSSLPLLKLMTRAREDVTILLSGEGGDELMAGYGNYRLPWWKVWLKKFRKGDATPFSHMFNDKALVACPPTPVAPWSMEGFSTLQKRQSADLCEWLPHDLLTRLDRVSMHNGIEGRVPYLDDDFSAWAFSLPDTMKVGTPDGGKPLGKWIVRQWLARQGHADLAFGRKKGFSVPVGDYLSAHQADVAAVWQQSPLINQLLKPHAADNLLKQLAHPKAANLCFSLTTLALWHRIHIEGESVTP